MALRKMKRRQQMVKKIEGPTQAFGVSMETMLKIAEVLEIPVSKLFED